jgi:DNA-3-methyladenine glycosylase II
MISDPLGTDELTREGIRKAERHLSRQDLIMAQIISSRAPCNLSDLSYRPFSTLARSIIGQQLSSKAAETISKRVRRAIGGGLAARRIYSVSVEDLRSCGLSRTKAAYIKEIARRVVENEFAFSSIRCAPAEDVLESLLELPGVGRWTAEMFMIFGLKHPDVLALDDAGLRRAAKLLYGSDDLASLAKNWHPYCSVASWYLWAYLDGQ